MLSALLVNDIVVFAMTPLLCTGLAARNLDPRPFLFGLAAASNAGSAATLIGNPQNILIGQAGALGFWSYFADAVVPSLVGLVISLRCIALVWRSSLAAPVADAPLAASPFDRRADRHLRYRAGRAAGPVRHAAAARDLRAAGRRLPDREPRPSAPASCSDEIDLPLLILFAGAVRGERRLRAHRPAGGGGAQPRLATACCPTASRFLAPIALFLSNTIGNVPAVVMILKVWHGIPQGTLVGLAILSTLAGNLFLVGSLANLIVAERAAGKACG